MQTNLRKISNLFTAFAVFTDMPKAVHSLLSEQ